MWEPWVRSLGWEVPWRRERLPIAVFWPGESLWTEEPGGLQSMESHRVEHNQATKRSIAHIWLGSLNTTFIPAKAQSNYLKHMLSVASSMKLLECMKAL